MNDIMSAINEKREWLLNDGESQETRKQRSEDVRDLRHRLAHVILQAKTVDPGSKVEILR